MYTSSDARQLVYDAVNYLQRFDDDKATEQNGVGFSKSDSQLGHIAANLPISDWDSDLTIEIAGVLVKYLDTQLSHFDTQVIRVMAERARGRDAIRATVKRLKKEEELQAFRDSRKLFIGDNGLLAAQWEYKDPEFNKIKEMVRSIKGRGYNANKRQWSIPKNDTTRPLVKKLVEDFRFTCSDYVAAWLAQAAYVEPVDEYVEPVLPLYPHQESGIEYLRSNDKAMLTDEMGLGKTIQALLAIPKDVPALIVCPASLKGNWANEVLKWRPDLKPVILQGRKSFRWPVFSEGHAEIIITNYEILPKEGTSELFHHRIIAVVDEAHYLKKYKAARTKNWRDMAKAILENGGKIWGMTGTPLVTSPADLWGCLQSFFLAKQGYEDFYSFMDAWGGYHGEYGIEWDCGDIDEIEAQEGLDKCSFGRKRIDVLPDLPPKRWTDIYVKVPRGCGAIDRELLKELREWDGGPLPIAGELAKARRELAIAKGVKAMPFIEELIEGGGGPIVVFSAHIDPVKDLGKKDGWACITGETPSAERTEIVSKFQRGELEGIAGTYAMATGITLTRSCRMVFLSLDWSPANNAQAEDRICRIGAEHDACEYFRIVASTEVDEIIHNSICRKMRMINNVDEQRKL
jgi:SNF2 family DNA or RNA helicase|tara:strand:+ start:2605 stop:4494 length:1890 start_codon:yes stop_codon:yes gene_type:complete